MEFNGGREDAQECNIKIPTLESDGIRKACQEQMYIRSILANDLRKWTNIIGDMSNFEPKPFEY